jgi:hypothetical protein
MSFLARTPWILCAALSFSAVACAVDTPEDALSDDADGEEIVESEQAASTGLGDHTYRLSSLNPEARQLQRLRLDVNSPPDPPKTFARIRFDRCVQDCTVVKEQGRWALTKNATTGRTYIRFAIGIQDSLGHDRYEYTRGIPGDPNGLRLRWVSAQDTGRWFQMKRVD